MSAKMENIVINVDFQRRDLSPIFANEVQVVPGDIAWEDLELMLKVYSDHNCIKVSYADEDNDMVIIESQEELQEAFKVARKCNNTLKLTVICDDQLCATDALEGDRCPAVSPTADDNFLYPFGEGQFLQLGASEPWLPTHVARGFGDPVDETSFPDYFSAAAYGEKERGDLGNDNLKELKKDVAKESSHRGSFFIASARCRHLVLDVEAFATHPGARVILYDKKHNGIISNQLWYKDDQTATIRTCLNDYCLDVVDGRLVINPCDLNKTSQKWAFMNNRIQNVFNEKWVIGLKTEEPNAFDEAFGQSESELVHTEWLQQTPDVEEYTWSGNQNRWNALPQGISCCLYPYETAECHRNVVVICDICNQTITGVRFKCGFCPDFDLCAACEARGGVHDESHLLLKMSVPQDQLKLRFATLEPVLMTNVFGYAPRVPFGMTSVCRRVQKMAEMEDEMMRNALEREEKIRWKEKCQRKSEEALDLTQTGNGPMEADVLFHKDNYDGIPVRSGMEIVKQWVVQNTGDAAWNSAVTMKEFDRKPSCEIDYTVTSEPSSFSGLPPDGVISITVTAIAPPAKDSYHSFWRLHDGKEYFGPVLEFAFTVSLELESTAPVAITKQMSDGEATVGGKGEKEDEEEVLQQDSRNSKLLMVEDLLNAELNREYIMTLSSLAVPSNTPLGDTPPYTPMVIEPSEPDLMSESGETTEAASAADKRDFVNMAVMADLVHRKMSDLVTNEEYDYVDVDGGSDSSDSSDSSNDFYIVPIPDCFNPNLPPRKEASNTVIIKKSDAKGSCSLKSVDEMLRTSSCLATAPLLSPKSFFSTASLNDLGSDLPKPKNSDLEDSLFEEFDEPKCSSVQLEESGTSVSEDKEPAYVEIVVEETAQEEATHETDANTIPDENSNLEMNINQNEMDHDLEHDGEMEEAEEPAGQQVEEDVSRQEGRVESEPADETAHSSGGVEASTLKLMSTVFSFVAKTAKDVFSTLQDKNSYIPPRCDWNPPQNQWTPRGNTWSPPQSTWTPPQSTWSPPQSTWSPPAAQWNQPANANTSFPAAEGQRSAMDQLIDMGFADRPLNQQLLLSCENNVEAVVQKLVEINGSIR